MCPAKKARGDGAGKGTQSVGRDSSLNGEMVQISGRCCERGELQHSSRDGCVRLPLATQAALEEVGESRSEAVDVAFFDRLHFASMSEIVIELHFSVGGPIPVNAKREAV